ncbi:MAG: DNA helicase RecQ [Bacteroidetes bacterium]|nr:DNA helicase RecQ [Bacteroidota bacterium]
MESIFLKNKLKEIFGYTDFRKNQEEILNYFLKRKDLLVIMPTGSGKSLCYQLPAAILPGMAIIISPLIALMKDQVDFLNSKNINSEFISSSLSKKNLLNIHDQIKSGQIKMLYIAPESFTKEDTINFLKTINISFIAIDEAHCISEWGHNFRPEYRKIRPSVDKIANIPIIALTATATPRVQRDIMQNLNIEKGGIFKSSFKRDNLYYEVRPKIDEKKYLIHFIKKNKNKAGIIYCHSRKTVEELSEFLNINEIKSAPYHAGLDVNIRSKNQEDFLKEEINIVVATIAFGMGIDKPDVRFVFHYDIPKSIEGYYQETGRAGRDNMPSKCIMFFSDKDASKLEKYNKDKPVSEKLNAKLLIDEVRNYSITPICRRNQLLYYFGETNIMQDKCNNCDNCINPTPIINSKNQAILILNTIKSLNQPFKEKYIAQIIYGDFNSKIQSHQHDKLSFYGKGKDFGNINYWKVLIRQLLFKNFIDRNDNYLLKINYNGINFLKNPFDLKLNETKDFTKINNLSEINKNKEKDEKLIYNEILYKLLIDLRKKVAKNNKIESYLVFSDSILEDMATYFPTTIDSLSRITNVGTSKAKKFGDKFIKEIQKFVDENDNIEPMHTILYKPDKANQKDRLYLIKQIDRKLDLEELAYSKNIQLEDLLKKIEEICYSGLKVNIDYYINNHLVKERQEEIYEYFHEAKSDNIDKAIKDLEYEYDEVEVRLMHIKFISEMAN